MARTPESSHAKNIDNLRIIAERATSYGVVYNPPTQPIKVVNMNAMYTVANGLHEDENTAYEATKLPINAREVLFNKVKRLVTRTINLYEVTEATKQAKKDARGLVRKITGSNVKIIRLEDGTPDPNHISNSHQGYVQVLDNFKKLVELYRSDVNYAPNETNINIASLDTWVTNLEDSMTGVSAVLSNEVHVRNLRDKYVYTMDTGLIDVGLACKKYIKSLFGPTSVEYKAIEGIIFTRFMKLSE
jgi:hypothetical protein